MLQTNRPHGSAEPSPDTLDNAGTLPHRHKPIAWNGSRPFSSDPFWASSPARPWAQASARLRGVLVVDRYHGYNRAPCAPQYCYAHLLRDGQDLEKKFPEHTEIKQFVSAFAPLLARAIQCAA